MSDLVDEKPKTLSSKVAKIGLITIVAAVVLVTFFAMAPALTQVNKQNGEKIDLSNIVMTSKNLRIDNIGQGNMVAWVDVSVCNKGKPGTVVVWAEVGHESISHGTWQQNKIIYLNANESRNLTFVFPILSPTPCMARHSILWRVWVTAP